MNNNTSAERQLTVTEIRTRLGFRDGINGPHAARTMMLTDIATLLESVPGQAGRQEYANQVIGANCLAKPTKKARELAFRFLAAMYGLDPTLPLFRAFRKLWSADQRAQPVVALCVALARDPLLRSTSPFITTKQPGEVVTRGELEKTLADLYPNRFTPASIRSFAQNINGTWTQAGFLTGHVRKERAIPVVTSTNVAFALFLGYLEGLSGPRLLTSGWINLLGCDPHIAEGLAGAASQRGLLLYMAAGGVKEIRFPGYLTEQEEQWRLEVSHV